MPSSGVLGARRAPTPSTITIVEPGADSVWRVGSTHNISWRYTRNFTHTSGTVALRLYSADVQSMTIAIFVDVENGYHVPMADSELCLARQQLLHSRPGF